ncbi:hypothetical protein FBY40_1337 [Microbacterium sp. SLBN-154]|uniref:DUF6326 family protein n=1 Tax=Microbacterium sp. SLBN-154 TaxID=2768458 RepID=UPI0011544AD5|nr:DUF6326 family protein [Microbacterium sp. SLBN-154]TQK18848.1 hypothetical protein FBY40_1337 [Microbacterium sp. SLBN-154]
MTTSISPKPPLDSAPMSVRAKLAAAWTSFMFLYVYVDVLNFYKPGVVDGILDGLVWRFDISATLLTIFLVTVSLPAVMVVLSTTLPARVNRTLNLVVAALLIPYSIFNAAGSTWEWAVFYAISIGVELLILAFILRTAWTWPRGTATSDTSAAAAGQLARH